MDDKTSIFAAMGLPDAEEMAENADLVYEITRADRLRAILHGRTETISTAKLEAVLRGLGRDLIKVSVPTTRADGRGGATVIGGEAVTAAVAAMGDARTR